MARDDEAMSDKIVHKRGVRSHLTSDIDPKWADLLLFICFFCSGLVDSMAFNMYGSFVSMQTGNTIFLGLGVNGQPDSAPRLSWTKSLCAIVCFSLGSLFFSTFHRLLGPQKRWVLITNFALQALIVGIVALISTVNAIPNHPATIIQSHDDDFLIFTLPSKFPGSDFAPIALLAFQSAGQIVASRCLKYNAMPTVVLTSLYCDLMSDAALFTAPLKDNKDRNRRVLGAVLLLLGAICGAYLTRSKAGFMGGLWIACVLKVGIAVAWCVWREGGGKK